MTDTSAPKTGIGGWANFFHSLGADILVKNVFPFLGNLAKGEVEHKVEDAKKKKGDKTTFGRAMTELKAVVPDGMLAFDIITDFMTDHGDPDCLTTDTDREDFQINAARTGPDVKETVDFLMLVAMLPDHRTRKEFLEAIGYIGARSVDTIEWAKAQLAQLRARIPSLSGTIDTMLKNSEVIADSTAQILSDAVTANQLDTKAAAWRQRAEAGKAQRRNRWNR